MRYSLIQTIKMKAQEWRATIGYSDDPTKYKIEIPKIRYSGMRIEFEDNFSAQDLEQIIAKELS